MWDGFPWWKAGRAVWLLRLSLSSLTWSRLIAFSSSRKRKGPSRPALLSACLNVLLHVYLFYSAEGLMTGRKKGIPKEEFSQTGTVRASPDRYVASDWICVGTGSRPHNAWATDVLGGFWRMCECVLRSGWGVNQSGPGLPLEQCSAPALFGPSGKYAACSALTPEMMCIYVCVFLYVLLLLLYLGISVIAATAWGGRWVVRHFFSALWSCPEIGSYPFTFSA